MAMGVICVFGYPVWKSFERRDLEEGGVSGKVVEGFVTLVFGVSCVWLFFLLFRVP